MNYAVFLQTNKYQTSLLAGQSYGGLLPSCLITGVPERATTSHLEQLLMVQNVGIDHFNDGFNSFVVLPETAWPTEVTVDYHWRLKATFNMLVDKARKVHERQRAESAASSYAP